MTRIKDSIFINAPVDKVHAMATDPHGWETWYVGLGEAQKVEGEGGMGTIVHHSYLLAGLHFAVTTEVTQNSKDVNGAYHWKSLFEGRLAGWQNWDYEPKEGGTQVTAEIEYTMPGSVLAKIANRQFVEKMQGRHTRHTLENLKHLMES